MAHPFQSDSVGAIFKALAEAQAQIQNPTKNAKNNHFKSAYTTLDEGLNVIREALSAVEIAVFQRTYMTDSLLIELFTEELPPKALQTLGNAFANGIADGLRSRQLLEDSSAVTVYCTPRRLAALPLKIIDGQLIVAGVFTGRLGASTT